MWSIVLAQQCCLDSSGPKDLLFLNRGTIQGAILYPLFGSAACSGIFSFRDSDCLCVLLVGPPLHLMSCVCSQLYNCHHDLHMRSPNLPKRPMIHFFHTSFPKGCLGPYRFCTSKQTGQLARCVLFTILFLQLWAWISRWTRPALFPFPGYAICIPNPIRHIWLLKPKSHIAVTWSSAQNSSWTIQG